MVVPQPRRGGSEVSLESDVKTLKTRKDPMVTIKTKEPSSIFHLFSSTYNNKKKMGRRVFDVRWTPELNFRNHLKSY